MSCMWNLKHDTNELTDERETDSGTQKTNMVTKEVRGWGNDKSGVWDQQMQITT